MKNWLHYTKLSILMLAVGFCYSCTDTSASYPTFTVQKAGPLDSATSVWDQPFTEPAIRGQFNPGFVTTAYWLRTTIVNPEQHVQSLMLILNNPHINHIRVYKNGHSSPEMELGDDLPFRQRAVQDRDLVIPVTLKAGESVSLLLWISKPGESLHLLPQIIEKERFVSIRQQEMFLMGAIVGWMILIILYCTILWVRLLDPVNILYAAYVLTISFWVITNWGLGFRYIWAETPYFSDKARPFFFLLSVFFFISVLLRFFPQKNIPLPLIRSVQAMIFLIGGTVLLLFVNYKPFGIVVKMFYLQSILIVFILSMLLIILYLTFLWRSGEKLVGYYVAGISFLILVPFILILYQYGIALPYQPFINTYGTSFSLLGETTIIALGISQRYSNDRKKIQQLSIELLEQETKRSQAMIQIQEEEQRRIGRDLHDSVGGLLATTLMVIQKMRTSQTIPELLNIEKLVTQSVAEMRSISHNLVSTRLIENGLKYALYNFVDQLNQNQHTRYSLYYAIEKSLTDEQQTIMYRICNELLHNINKHAEATEVSLQLMEEAELIQIIAEDNGKGFDKEQKHDGIGLKNLYQRIAYLKGNINIDSNTSGTTTIIQIPC